MKNKLMELLDIRSIIAILITLTFITLALMGIVEPNLIEYVVISVFGALFGAKKVVDSNKDGDK